VSWFEQLFGFREGSYPQSQSRFVLDGERLRSTVNGRDFAVGRFSTPSLSSLRTSAAGLAAGTLQVRHEIIGDVLELHAQPDNEGALFQVASQLNCLEFARSSDIPEHGITNYAADPTQGPACALAAAAATVFRNYFVQVDGVAGQTSERQLNNLDALQSRLGDAAGCIEVRNGYTFSDADRLRQLGDALAQHDRDELMSEIKIGLQTDVEVTFAERFVEPTRTQRVSQAFCSALSCSYTAGSLEQWAPLATMVLDCNYEATLLAAAIDAARGNGSGRVWLTLLGGGAFGNAKAWIGAAIARAVERLGDHALDVRVAHHRRIDDEIRAAVPER